jgi:hypothetical protein
MQRTEQEVRNFLQELKNFTRQLNVSKFLLKLLSSCSKFLTSCSVLCIVIEQQKETTVPITLQRTKQELRTGSQEHLIG